VGLIQHNIPFENAAGVLSWLLTAIKLGASKIVCLYGTFESPRQLFTAVRLGFWISRSVPVGLTLRLWWCLWGAVILIVGHCDDVSVFYLFFQNLLSCSSLVRSCTMCSLLNCFFSLRSQLRNSRGSQTLL